MKKKSVLRHSLVVAVLAVLFICGATLVSTSGTNAHTQQDNTQSCPTEMDASTNDVISTTQPYFARDGNERMSVEGDSNVVIINPQGDVYVDHPKSSVDPKTVGEAIACTIVYLIIFIGRIVFRKTKNK